MRVKNLKTGEISAVNDSYAMRLYEQGKATPAIEEKRPTAKAVKEKAVKKE